MAKILVIRNSALGDVAMTLPVIYSVAAAHPRAELYVLTRPFFARMFINAPSNVHIIEADFKGEYKGLSGLLRLVGKLRAMRFTHVADLHNVLRSWIIDAALRVSGAKVAMVDKARSRRIGAGIHRQRSSFIDRYADVFARLGFAAELTFQSLYAATPAPPVTLTHPAVGIAPFARYATKTYPPEKMLEVVRRLTKKGVNVYLFGGRGAEADTLEAWAADNERCTSLAGKMQLTDELAAMANLDAMVSMDSANQHLASLVGTPVVTLWGGTAPVIGFTPYRQSEHNSICLGLECQPCSAAGSAKCRLGTLACMRELNERDVADKVLSLLRVYPTI